MMQKFLVILIGLFVGSNSLALEHWIHLQCSDSNSVLRFFESIEVDQTGGGKYRTLVCWDNSDEDDGCCGYTNLSVNANEKFRVSKTTVMREGIPLAIDLNIPIPTFNENTDYYGTFIASDYYSRMYCGSEKLVLNLRPYPPTRNTEQ